MLLVHDFFLTFSYPSSSPPIANSSIATSYITCGSAVKLQHIDSSHYLNSDSFNWGTNPGSGQQVTTLSSKNKKSSASTYWQIQEAYNKTSCETGIPIRCGDTVRLLHLNTKKRLHSHFVKAALTPQHQEISAFGEGTGEHGMNGGDKSDDWNVICGDTYWIHERVVRLQHAATGAYLSSAKQKFTSRNCRNCPIIDELEVIGSKSMNHQTFFRAEQGVRIYK